MRLNDTMGGNMHVFPYIQLPFLQVKGRVFFTNTLSLFLRRTSKQDYIFIYPNIVLNGHIFWIDKLHADINENIFAHLLHTKFPIHITQTFTESARQHGERVNY